MKPQDKTRQSAIDRVKHPIGIPTTCHLCSGPVSLVNNSEIYHKEYGVWPWVYKCQDCKAYVGLHPFTLIPLGTLANLPMRAARYKAHIHFNFLWEGKKPRFTRSEAYLWLAEALEIKDPKDCHIGLFDIDMCNKTINAVMRKLQAGVKWQT